MTLVGEGGMVRATAEIYAGRTPEWYPSLRFGLHKFLPMLGAALLVMLAYFIVIFVTTIIGSIFLLGANSSLGPLFVLIFVMVFVAGFSVFLYIYITVIRK